MSPKSEIDKHVVKCLPQSAVKARVARGETPKSTFLGRTTESIILDEILVGNKMLTKLVELAVT